MVKRRERRHIARLTVPLQLSGPTGPEARQLRLWDLSADGARIEHFRALPDWSISFVELPPALGGLRLQGEVVWSRVVGWKRVADGRRLVSYQSGVTFRWLTAAQQTALTSALQVLGDTQEPAATPPPS